MIAQAIRFLVGQRLLVLALAATIAVGGFVAYQNLIIDVFPDPSPALVQVYTEAHGLAPQEVEQLVSIPVEAAMFGLPKVEAANGKVWKDDVDFLVELLKEEHIAFVPGSNYYSPGHFRVGLLASDDDLKEGFDRIDRFLGKRL